MKMNSKFFGLGAKLALCLAVVMGTMTSCYEKEDIKTVIDTTPKTATYTISGTVYNYANLDVIKNATLTLTNAAGNQVGRATSDPVNGNYSIKLENLTEADRGTYTLSIVAEGYKSRTTSIMIWFEKAENQAIATQMDFALKSNDIQGSPVEVVAGNDDQVVEISGSDEEGKPVTDKILVPAGLLDEAQTITIQREGQEAEKASEAIRVYEGKPDGLKFNKPLEFTFKADAGQNLKVYYEEGGIWTIADGDDANVVDNGDGTYTAKIWHFSRFKFSENDYDIEYGKIDTTFNVPVLAPVKADYVAYTGAEEATVAWKKPVMVGYRYKDGKSLSQVFDGCVIKDRVITEVENFLKDRDAINFADGAEFNTEVVDALTTTIPPYYNITELVVTYGTKTITIPVTVNGITYEVVVENVSGQTLNYVGEEYGTHGHGHGDDLNAGGGIIDFE